MIRSMTGFGRAEVERDGRALSAEIRTVNHKFCEVSVRLPRSLSFLENRARLKVQEVLTRGKVNVNVNWKDGRDSEGSLVLDEALAEQYIAGIERLKQRFALAEGLDMKTLVGLPDIFRWKEESVDEEAGWALLDDLLDRTLADLVRMREEEGKAIRADFEARIAGVLSHLVHVETRAPNRVAEARERLRARITQLLQGEAEVPEERIVVEASFLADKLDCTEESVRLRSHCAQFLDLIRSPEPAGRKLNFLVQEMNREVNTIGSKANDLEIGRHVISVKEEIEVLREQVQNVE